MEKDFLDEMIADRARLNPRFPDLVSEAVRRRAVARELTARREAKGLSQTLVAAKMGTAASVVSKLEGAATSSSRRCSATARPSVNPSRRHRHARGERPARRRLADHLTAAGQETTPPFQDDSSCGT